MDNVLFKIEAIVVDGLALAFEEGSASLDGAARFQEEVVMAASGDDFTRRSRVPTKIQAKLLFGAASTPEDYTKIRGAQITLRDISNGRRAICNKCSFASMGPVGNGPVDISFNVLAPIQWV